MRNLLADRARDVRAADAVDLFCHQAKKHLCAMTGSLGGIDTLVFAGGIGEKSSEIRSRICEGLEFLGLKIDSARNDRGDGLISDDGCRAMIRVIPTDEEGVMVQIMQRMLIPCMADATAIAATPSASFTSSRQWPGS